MNSLQKLSKGAIKQIVIKYNLKHCIKFSRVVDGKRKTLSKKELIQKLDEHVYVDEESRMIKRKNENLYQMPLEDAKKEHKNLVKVLEKVEKKVSDKAVKSMVKKEAEEQSAELKMLKKKGQHMMPDGSMMDNDKMKKAPKAKTPEAPKTEAPAGDKVSEGNKKEKIKQLFKLNLVELKKMASEKGIPLEITVNNKKQPLKRSSLISFLSEKI